MFDAARALGQNVSVRYSDAPQEGERSFQGIAVNLYIGLGEV
jgi:hypothetical protein